MLWLLILGGPALIVAIAFWAREMWRRAARAEIRSYLAEAFPDVRIVAERSAELELEGAPFDGAHVSLTNLFAELAAHRVEDSEERRRTVYRAFFEGARDQIEQLNAPLDLATVQERVFPMIVDEHFLRSLADHAPVPSRPVDATGLSVVYVLDHDDAVSYLTEAQRRELGVDAEELHVLALDNLRGAMTPEPVRRAVEGSDLVAVKTGDAFDATRLLLVPEHLEGDEELAVCIPDRDTLVLAPIPDDSDWSSLEKLARTPAGDRVVADRPLRVRRQGVAWA